ncbi:hypothetical protein ACIXMS_09670 [Bacteroides fragilis]
MRKSFNELFTVQNGTISPKVSIFINGITMTPGVSFSGGVSFGGVDLSQFVGKDLEVENHNGIYEIKGFYK